MRLHSIQPNDMLELLANLERSAGVPMPFGEVAVSDMSSESPRGLAAGEWADDRWTMLTYAIPNPNESTWTMEISIDPYREDAALAVVESAAHFAACGAEELVLWIHDPRLSVDATDFEFDRTLHRMIIDLPARQIAEWPDGVSARGFQLDRDIEAWLGLNNRAFAGHSEQSGWTADEFRLRMEMSWFDPEGLRMVWKSDRLVAFNWTKIVSDEAGVVGEIYVIAVDPEYHGMGLGRAATLEGLRDLHQRCGARSATLYVDEANTPGMALYKSLGFISTEIHRALRYRPRLQEGC